MCFSPFVEPLPCCDINDVYIFSPPPLNSMKRAASLNYLNKTSDDTFQVRKSQHNMFNRVTSCAYFTFSDRSPLQYLCCVFCVSVRLKEARISGKAGAWAPAPWISTLETDSQVGQGLIFGPPVPNVRLVLAHLSEPMWSPTTLPEGFRRPHAISLTLYPPPSKILDPKTWFSCENIFMCVDSSLVFKFKMVLLYGLPRTHRSIFSLLTVCVASVPPKCGQKKKLTSSLSVPNDHCESQST